MALTNEIELRWLRIPDIAENIKGLTKLICILQQTCSKSIQKTIYPMLGKVKQKMVQKYEQKQGGKQEQRTNHHLLVSCQISLIVPVI